jgi:hypothetical protein
VHELEEDHSGRGVQYLAIRYTERLADAGVVNSVGSKGDSYDNALAESVNGLYKAELIRRRRSWRTVEEVELATAGWVDWWNHRRLLLDADGSTNTRDEPTLHCWRPRWTTRPWPSARETSTAALLPWNATQPGAKRAIRPMATPVASVDTSASMSEPAAPLAAFG